MLSTPSAPEDVLRFNRRCLIAAFAVTLLWGAIYLGCNNDGMEDESGHFFDIIHFVEHRPGLPEMLPNLPGYHFLVILLAGEHPTMRSARIVTLGLSLLGLAAFGAAWRERHRHHPGAAMLLLALLPVMQPFTAMAYTDVPALSFILAAFWAQFAGRYALAAGCIVLACLMRQTCLVWAGYLLAWEGLNCFFPKPSDENSAEPVQLKPGLGVWLDRCRWLLLVMAIAATIVLRTGRFTVGQAHGNQLKANLALPHFAGILLLLLGLPFWLTRAVVWVRRSPEIFRARRGATLAWLAAAAIGGALLAISYVNPHAWNRELFWHDGARTFTLLRNWPLVGLDRIPALQWLSGFLAAGIGVGVAELFNQQICRRELWLLVPFGAALLFSNSLIDPRYFIPPFALALLFLEPGVGTTRRMVAWFALICAAQAPFLVQRLALW